MPRVSRSSSRAPPHRRCRSLPRDRRHYRGRGSAARLSGAVVRPNQGVPEGSADSYNRDDQRTTRRPRAWNRSDTGPVGCTEGVDGSARLLELRKPAQVDHAHFLENSDVGDAVDLSKFPVPHWHLKDGGPYIGSRSHPTGTEAVGRYFAFEDDHRCVQTLRMAQPVSGDLGNAPLKRRERSKKNDVMCWSARFEVINRIQLRGRTG